MVGKRKYLKRLWPKENFEIDETYQPRDPKSSANASRRINKYKICVLTHVYKHTHIIAKLLKIKVMFSKGKSRRKKPLIYRRNKLYE